MVNDFLSSQVIWKKKKRSRCGSNQVWQKKKKEKNDKIKHFAGKEIQYFSNQNAIEIIHRIFSAIANVIRNKHETNIEANIRVEPSVAKWRCIDLRPMQLYLLFVRLICLNRQISDLFGINKNRIEGRKRISSKWNTISFYWLDRFLFRLCGSLIGFQ